MLLITWLFTCITCFRFGSRLISRRPAVRQQSRPVSVKLNLPEFQGPVTSVDYAHEATVVVKKVRFPLPQYWFEVNEDAVKLNDKIVHRGIPSQTIVASPEGVKVETDGQVLKNLPIPKPKAAARQTEMGCRDPHVEFSSPVELRMYHSNPQGGTSLTAYDRFMMKHLGTVCFSYPKYDLTVKSTGDIYINGEKVHEGNGEESILADSDAVIVYRSGKLYREFEIAGL